MLFIAFTLVFTYFVLYHLDRIVSLAFGLYQLKEFEANEKLSEHVSEPSSELSRVDPLGSTSDKSASTNVVTRTKPIRIILSNTNDLAGEELAAYNANLKLRSSHITQENQKNGNLNFDKFIAELQGQNS